MLVLPRIQSSIISRDLFVDDGECDGDGVAEVDGFGKFRRLTAIHRLELGRGGMIAAEINARRHIP